MKTTDIGFEKFEEDFTADVNTMYIKPGSVDSANVIQTINSSFERRKALYEYEKRMYKKKVVKWQRQ